MKAYSLRRGFNATQICKTIDSAEIKWQLFLSRYNILVKGSRNPLLQEHDSVMLGEISPHREYYDSKSSTETPPSYNQLNYNENIERFFKSKPPVATMYGSDEENINSSNDEGEKTSPNSAGELSFHRKTSHYWIFST